MSTYRVQIIERDTGEHVYWFECQADSEDHALEQAEDAALASEIVVPCIVSPD